MKFKNNEEAILVILEACKYLKWQVALSSEQEECTGLVVGTQKYIDEILSL